MIEEKESMRQAVNADIEIGSWYSGWDPDFLAIEAVRRALGAKCIDFIHSSEICSDRSQFILAHPRKCQPKHLFGDFTMRMPPNILEAAAVLQADAQRIASQRVAAGEQPACIKEEVDRVFILRYITCSTMWPSHLSRNVLSVAKGALFGRYS